MGAQQSSSRDTGGQSSVSAKRCYYEALGLERNATDEEVKKAYRRKALELHPDRNFSDVENATAKFAEVQSAYEVLSDPQERSWYDAHRDSILRGDSGSADDVRENLSVTSAASIVSFMGKYNSNVPFTNASNGFYGGLAELFGKLAREEEEACNWGGVEVAHYPDFGGKDDDYEDEVKTFYRIWTNFSTQKSFGWRDQYRASEAPDRATRRLAEKENKRLRDEGIREFNDAVRNLVLFVRKRDPRYSPNTKTEAERQKILRDLAAAQAARSRAENRAKLEKHVVPDWAQSKEQEEDGHFEDSEEEEIEEIECVVCRKTFKSEKQYEAHEKSKKHAKAVLQLQREMRKENKHLSLDKDTESEPSHQVTQSEELDIKTSEQAPEINVPLDHEEGISASEPLTPEKKSGSPKTTEQRPHPLDLDDQSSDLDDEYAFKKEVETRLVESIAIEDCNDSTAATLAATSDNDGAPKLGKAKLKKAKKKARQEMAAQEKSRFDCVSCDESFASKNQLFNHINEFPNHAQRVLRPTDKIPKKKKR